MNPEIYTGLRNTFKKSCISGLKFIQFHGQSIQYSSWNCIQNHPNTSIKLHRNGEICRLKKQNQKEINKRKIARIPRNQTKKLTLLSKHNPHLLSTKSTYYYHHAKPEIHHKKEHVNNKNLNFPTKTNRFKKSISTLTIIFPPLYSLSWSGSSAGRRGNSNP